MSNPLFFLLAKIINSYFIYSDLEKAKNRKRDKNWTKTGQDRDKIGTYMKRYMHPNVLCNKQPKCSLTAERIKKM